MEIHIFLHTDLQILSNMGTRVVYRILSPPRHNQRFQIYRVTPSEAEQRNSVFLFLVSQVDDLFSP